MKYVALPRRGGKTYYLLTLWASNPTSLYLCFTEAEAERIRELAHLRFPEISHADLQRRICSISDRQSLRGTEGRVYVDNVDHILADYIGRAPEMVSFTP